MVRRLIGQRKDLVDQRRLPLGAHMLECHFVQDSSAELGPLRRRKNALPRFDPGQESVSLQDLSGEAVVVEDRGLLAIRKI